LEKIFAVSGVTGVGDWAEVYKLGTQNIIRISCHKTAFSGVLLLINLIHREK
jgi:hypothetical protein